MHLIESWRGVVGGGAEGEKMWSQLLHPPPKYLLLHSCHLLPEWVSVCIYLYNYKKALTLQCILYYAQYIRG